MIFPLKPQFSSGILHGYVSHNQMVQSPLQSTPGACGPVPENLGANQTKFIHTPTKIHNGNEHWLTRMNIDD